MQPTNEALLPPSAERRGLLKKGCAGGPHADSTEEGNLEPGLVAASTAARTQTQGPQNARSADSARQRHAGDAPEALEQAAVGDGLPNWWPVNLASDGVTSTAPCPDATSLLHDLLPARSFFPSNYTSSCSFTSNRLVAAMMMPMKKPVQFLAHTHRGTWPLNCSLLSSFL